MKIIDRQQLRMAGKCLRFSYPMNSATTSGKTNRHCVVRITSFSQRKCTRATVSGHGSELVRPTFHIFFEAICALDI